MDKSRGWFFALVLLSVFAVSRPAMAGVTQPPEPPDANPHPPVSAADKRRVVFAEEAVRLLLSQAPPAFQKPPRVDPSGFQNKNLACLKDFACYSKDQPFMVEMTIFKNGEHRVVETRHAHVIPWSMRNFKNRGKIAPTVEKSQPGGSGGGLRAAMGPRLQPDEYMVHIYARLEPYDKWYHLDVILTEDEKGTVFLRHFYYIPLPHPEERLPPGTVC